MNIGPYEILDELGRGGAGAVFRARGPDGTEVAVKILHAVRGGKSGEPALARFERERRLLGELASEGGFVPLLDAGEGPRGPWLAMPLLEGGTLRGRLVQRERLPTDEAVALVRALALAMGRAHARGIVHRDLKPENVLFDREGRPHVADLGLAKHFLEGAPGAAASVSLSRTGEFRGTAGYMAPEQMNDAKSVGPQADVFALGAILYECLSGRPPFEGESVIELVDKATRGAFEPLGPLAPGAPRELVALVHATLAPSPAARPADGAALASRLDRAVVARAPRSRALVAAALVMAAAIAACLAAWTARRPSPAEPPRIEPARPTAPAAPSPSTPAPAAPPSPAIPDALRPLVQGHRARLAAVLGSPRLHHAAAVNAIAVSPDGSRIATAGVENFIRVWDARTGDELLTLRRHTEAATCVTYAAGDRIVSAALDGRVCVWNARTGALISARSTAPQRDDVNALALMHGGTIAFAGTKSGNVLAFSIDEPDSPPKQIHSQGPAVTAIGVSPSEQIFSGDKDGKIVVGDPLKGRLVGETRPYQALVKAVAPVDDRIHIVGYADGMLYALDLQGGPAIYWHAHPSALHALCLSKDGKLLVTAGDNLTAGEEDEVAIFELQGQKPNQLRRIRVSRPRCVAFLDPSTIAVGTFDHSIRIFDVATGRELRETPGHRGWIADIAVSADGARALTAGKDGTARLWDLASGRQLRVLEHRSMVYSTAFAPDGRLVATGAQDGAVRIWDPESGSLRATLAGHQDIVGRLLFAKDGLLASASWDGILRTWKIAPDGSGTEARSFGERHARGSSPAITFGPDARKAYYANGDAKGDWPLTVWEIETGTWMAARGGTSLGCRSIAVDRDERFVLIGTRSGELQMASLRDPLAPVERLEGHARGREITSIAISPEGHRAASAGDDGTLKLWDLATRRELDSIDLWSAIGDKPLSVAFAGDGALLVGTHRGLLLRYEIAPGR
jgi:WD40 repeat protein/serine/threonine protein kinase